MFRFSSNRMQDKRGVVSTMALKIRCVFSEFLEVPLRDRLIWAAKTAAAVAALCLIGWQFGQRYEIRYDPQVMSCIDAEILLIDTKDKSPRVGEVFAYRSKNAMPVYADGTHMAKYIAAGPGDRVEITEDLRILVNGKQWAQGLPHLSGMSIEEIRSKFCGVRTLGEDEYWMLGTSPRSFDSRYWGSISSAQLLGRAYTIF